MSAPIRVVMADDEPAYRNALQKTLTLMPDCDLIAVCKDGQEALEACLADPPDVLLTDINMPRMNGIELLDWLRTQPHLCRSIVFAFTTSEAQQDCKAAYDRQVAGYLVKSHLGSGYAALARMLDTYTQTVLFPPASVTTN